MSDLGRELINQMILVIFVEEVWVTGVLRSHPDWEEEDPAVSSSQGGQAGRRRPFYGRDPDGPVGGCPWAGSLLRLLTHRESPHSCSWLPGHACFELLLQRPSDERHKPALFSDPWCSSEGLWWKGPHSHTPSILALPSLWTLEENLFFWPLLSQLHWFVVFPLFFFFYPISVSTVGLACPLDKNHLFTHSLVNRSMGFGMTQIWGSILTQMLYQSGWARLSYSDYPKSQWLKPKRVYFTIMCDVHCGLAGSCPPNHI